MITFNNIETENNKYSQIDVHDTWSQVSNLEIFQMYTFSDFLEVVNCHLNSDPSKYSFNPKSWEISVSGGVFKSLIMSGLLTMILKLNGDTNIPLSLLTILIPMFFDIQKITLDEREKKVHMDLTKTELAYVHAHSPESLYDDYLSDEIKRDLNKLDFIQFLGKLKKMGLLKNITKEKFILKSVGKFHLHFNFS